MKHTLCYVHVSSMNAESVPDRSASYAARADDGEEKPTSTPSAGPKGATAAKARGR
jgi:hypothetical protein